MAVPSFNLTLDKGTDFEASFNVKNSDGTAFSLTNYSATAKIRKHFTATAHKTFQVGITSSTGEIKISMGSTDTSTLTSGRNYYDILIIQSGTNKTKKVYEGMILVKDTVSV